jgi:hypothetical protein
VRRRSRSATRCSRSPAAEGRTLDETESESFDTLDGESGASTHLVRLNSPRRTLEKRAVPVNGTSTAAASQSRSGVPSWSSPANTRPASGSPATHGARRLQRQQVRSRRVREADVGRRADEVVAGLRDGLIQTRAAVAPGTTVQATFAAPLVITNYLNDFLELLRPATLLGRIPGLRHVPFNVSMPAQTAGGTYKWVGQGKMKPVTNAQYAVGHAQLRQGVGHHRADRGAGPALHAVRGSGGARRAGEGHHAVPRRAVRGLDGRRVANVNPASITNGVTGTAASAPRWLRLAPTSPPASPALAALGYNVNELVILMSESIAFALGLGAERGRVAALPRPHRQRRARSSACRS